jgi:hypothetical protein
MAATPSNKVKRMGASTSLRCNQTGGLPNGLRGSSQWFWMSVAPIFDQREMAACQGQSRCDRKAE